MISFAANSLLLFIATLGTPLVLFAEQSVATAFEQQAQDHELKIAVADLLPWGYVMPDGRLGGMLVDFHNELLARTNLKYQFYLQPYPRVIQAIASGEVDMAVMIKSPSADDLAASLGPVLAVPVIVLVLASDPRKFESLKDFEGLAVSQVRGAKYGIDFDNNTLIKRFNIPHADQALRMLKAGRVDAMIATEQAVLFSMHSTGFRHQHFRIAIPVFYTNAEIYVSKKGALSNWANQVKITIDLMRESGELTKSFYQNAPWRNARDCFYGQDCSGKDALD